MNKATELLIEVEKKIDGPTLSWVFFKTTDGELYRDLMLSFTKDERAGYLGVAKIKDREYRDGWQARFKDFTRRTVGMSISEIRDAGLSGAEALALPGSLQATGLVEHGFEDTGTRNESFYDEEEKHWIPHVFRLRL